MQAIVSSRPAADMQVRRMAGAPVRLEVATSSRTSALRETHRDAATNGRWSQETPHDRPASIKSRPGDERSRERIRPNHDRARDPPARFDHREPRLLRDAGAARDRSESGRPRGEGRRGRRADGPAGRGQDGGGRRTTVHQEPRAGLGPATRHGGRQVGDRHTATGTRRADPRGSKRPASHHADHHEAVPR